MLKRFINWWRGVATLPSDGGTSADRYEVEPDSDDIGSMIDSLASRVKAKKGFLLQVCVYFENDKMHYRTLAPIQSIPKTMLNPIAKVCMESKEFTQFMNDMVSSYEDSPSYRESIYLQLMNAMDRNDMPSVDKLLDTLNA